MTKPLVAGLRSAARGSMLLALVCAPPGTHSGELALYGSVDAAIGHVRAAGGASGLALRSGQAAVSRVGLRGREALGDDLHARFNLEAGFDVDSGAGRGARDSLAWDRQSWVGLDSRYGSLQLGRQYRPETRAVFVMDPFDGSSVASPPNTYSALAFRSDDAVVYESPQLGRWRALVMLVPNGRRDIHGDRGHALLYRSGPLRLAYGGDRRRTEQPAGQRVSHSLGGSYELRGLTLYAAWRSRQEDAAGLDERSGWLGVSLPLERFTLRGVVGAASERGNPRAATTGIGLGFDYRLSQRADLYGRYATLRNRHGARFDLGDRPAGRAPQTQALGLRLRF